MSKLIMLLSHECEGCGGLEERVFTDSWSGKELCPGCLHKIVGKLTMSPASEGDNLLELMDELED